MVQPIKLNPRAATPTALVPLGSVTVLTMPQLWTGARPHWATPLDWQEINTPPLLNYRSQETIFSAQYSMIEHLWVNIVQRWWELRWAGFWGLPTIGLVRDPYKPFGCHLHWLLFGTVYFQCDLDWAYLNGTLSLEDNQFSRGTIRIFVIITVNSVFPIKRF